MKRKRHCQIKIVFPSERRNSSTGNFLEFLIHYTMLRACMYVEPVIYVVLRIFVGLHILLFVTCGERDILQHFNCNILYPSSYCEQSANQTRYAFKAQIPFEDFESLLQLLGAFLRDRFESQGRILHSTQPKNKHISKKNNFKMRFSSSQFLHACPPLSFHFSFRLVIKLERVNYLIGLSAKEALRRRDHLYSRVPLYSRAPLYSRDHLYSRVPFTCSVRAEAKSTSLSTFRICISQMKNEMSKNIFHQLLFFIIIYIYLLCCLQY